MADPPQDYTSVFASLVDPHASATICRLASATTRSTLLVFHPGGILRLFREPGIRRSLLQRTGICSTGSTPVDVSRHLRDCRTRGTTPRSTPVSEPDPSYRRTRYLVLRTT